MRHHFSGSALFAIQKLTLQRSNVCRIADCGVAILQQSLIVWQAAVCDESPLLS